MDLDLDSEEFESFQYTCVCAFTSRNPEAKDFGVLTLDGNR